MKPLAPFSVLIPYGPDGGWRDRTFEWNLARWEKTTAQICVAAPDHVGEPGMFNRPQAINRAAAAADRDFFIVADADTTFEWDWLTRVVDLGGWSLPTSYVKVNEESTLAILSKAPGLTMFEWDVLGPRLSAEWEGESWSGLLALPREAFDVVGGFDERFTGWGHDDIAFGVACDTLWKPHVRVRGRALHLWHPTPFSDNYGQPNNEVQRLLAVEYVKAAGDPDRMRQVMG